MLALQFEDVVIIMARAPNAIDDEIAAQGDERHVKDRQWHEVVQHFLRMRAHVGGLGAQPAVELIAGGKNRLDLRTRARFLERLNDILDRRWLTNRGNYVIELMSPDNKVLQSKQIVVVAGQTTTVTF